MFKPGEEHEIQTVTCPYDPAHFMAKSSFIRHIERCKSNQKYQFKQCPYDVYHIIRKTNYDAHLKVCKSKKDYEHLEQSIWGEIQEDEDSENEETYSTKFNKIEKPVQSFIKKNSQNVSKSNDYDIIKALGGLKIKEQKEDDENSEYWIELPSEEKKSSIINPPNQLQSSKVSESSHNSHFTKIQVPKVRNLQVEIAKKQGNMMKSQNMRKPSGIYSSCVGPSKESFLKGEKNKKTVDYLSMSYHPDMNLRPSKVQDISGMYSDLDDSQSSAYGFPQYSQYSRYPPGYYGQAYNNTMIQNGYIMYQYPGYNQPLQLHPPHQQINFPHFQVYHQTRYQNDSMNSHYQDEKLSKMKKEKHDKKDRQKNEKSQQKKEKKAKKHKE